MNSQRFALASNCLCALVLAALLLAPISARSAETDSIVTIYAKSARGTSSQGTGFYVSTTGQILTAYHVIRNAVELEVYDKDLSKLKNVVVSRIDEKRDLALLGSTQSGQVPKLSLASTPPGAFSDAKIAGSPRGLPQQVIYGKLTAASYVASTSVSSAGGKRVFQENIDILPIDITVYSGMSGAPVMLPSGAVIGVLSGSFDEGRGLAWVIPIKYFDHLTARPAIGKPASDTFSWPQLSLMATSWVGLQRSYSKAFDSIHIAKLESLEGMFRTLRGTWRGQSEFKKTVYSDASVGNYFGSCHIVGRMSHQITFSEVDVDEPQLVGTFTSTTRGRVLIEHGNNGTSSGRDILRRNCGQTSDASDETAVTSKGPLFAESEVDEDEPTDKKGLQTLVNIEDCADASGTQCPAKSFGEKKMARVEVISRTKIRWQNTILERVAP